MPKTHVPCMILLGTIQIVYACIIRFQKGKHKIFSVKAINYLGKIVLNVTFDILWIG